MRILSVDSSLGTQVAVLAAPGPTGTGGTSPVVLAHMAQDSARQHAESLGPMLAQVLTDSQAGDAALDAVVVATGPAPFTGLRAGLVAARTVGRARGVPVYGVPSLDAVARAALDALTGADAVSDPVVDPVVLVATDARRREVYAARYRGLGPDDVIRLGEIVVCPPQDVGDLGSCDAVAGSGAVLYPVIRSSVSPTSLSSTSEGGGQVLTPVSGDCRAQVRVALARLARGEQLPTDPLYLRHADVHVPPARGGSQ
ncbi:tRNA (adenosine(37)-N6)-threonylcarbamoyltransferase complex dimerization subunit type 1 TsaB [Actinomyces lilanjuaniae]|uniref:tRNA (Adenosine(37)-N6)-threonylcarbamoyltransferase complex dimerization subunit type 1 TsaB n=1 Tax=Actinomyces lilanjuaniae TaxID=2321394 RepID=A0ABN5PRT6_9ACTO|nr:tRNA (adenosine(37)-N6)-threonylcarbamoyltransferase complex dimerization subunit type 1 TsaB [Actinomyces lilanjuaniae]AYD89346.1 tRNA (adenosine(37)-N6)-threonylcarbamoyltransferase complex dimerization subunit type 1 TsaB [Actinomyces lilanjuaniae]